MRIVSQNRDISVEFDNVILKICNGSLIYAYPYANQAEVIVLGKFASPERTREVFEDIHNAYAPVNLITCALTEEEIKQFIGSENVKPRIIMMPEDREWVADTHDNQVYYMPEK